MDNHRWETLAPNQQAFHELMDQATVWKLRFSQYQRLGLFRLSKFALDWSHECIHAAGTVQRLMDKVTK